MYIFVSITNKTKYMRVVEFTNIDGKTVRGFFHQWLPIIGSICAVVELSDGAMTTVFFDSLRFVTSPKGMSLNTDENS